MKLIIKSLFTLLLFIITLGYSNAAINMAVSPIKYEINTQTGATIIRSAKVINRSNGKIFIKTGKSDFEVKDESGNPKFTRKSELVYQDQELSNWITIETDSFELEAGEEKDINFTIQIPDNATPGGHYGAVFFKNNNSENSAGSSIKINVDYGVLLLVNIDGEIVKEGEFDETEVKIISNGRSRPLSIKKDDCPLGDLTYSKYDGKCIDSIFEEKNNDEEEISKENTNSGEINNENDLTESEESQNEEGNEFEIVFDTPFINKGNTHIKPEGTIKLIDENGKELKAIGKKIIKNENGTIIGEEIVDYLPINDVGGNVLPSSKRVFISEWKGFPYQTYDEDGAKIIKYWSPDEYYTRQNTKEKTFLMPWERLNERINHKKIVAETNFKYTDIDGEEVNFNSAQDFYVDYKEKYVGINPYFVILIAILGFILFIIFIILRKRKTKCIKCEKTIDKNMKICPYCTANQEKTISGFIKSTIEKHKKKTEDKKKKKEEKKKDKKAKKEKVSSNIEKVKCKNCNEKISSDMKYCPFCKKKQ